MCYEEGEKEKKKREKRDLMVIKNTLSDTRPLAVPTPHFAIYLRFFVRALRSTPPQHTCCRVPHTACLRRSRRPLRAERKSAPLSTAHSTMIAKSRT